MFIPIQWMAAFGSSVQGLTVGAALVRLVVLPGVYLRERLIVTPSRVASALCILTVGVVFMMSPDAVIRAETVPTSAAKQPTAITGPSVSDLEGFDSAMSAFMARWNMPGGQLAVVKDGRLVYARGFGYADKQSGSPVMPDSLFRVGSISKTITATAVMKLVEDGQLGFDNGLYFLLSEVGRLKPPPGANIDPLLKQVTVRMLLSHTGGWMTKGGLDPVKAYARVAAEAVKEPSPASSQAMARFMLGQPLTVPPGTEFHYSNIGYVYLGRVIEAVTKQRYEDYVKTAILAPAGVTRMTQGRTRLKDRLDKEVRYYPEPDVPDFWSVFPDEATPVTFAYGGDGAIESTDSSGSWLATAADLLKFLTAVDSTVPVQAPRKHLLSPASVKTMMTCPALPEWTGKAPRPPGYAEDECYALGWVVGAQGETWNHAGALAGTFSMYLRDGRTGVSWAAIFNAFPGEKVLDAKNDLVKTMRDAGAQVKQWPQHDRFERN